MGVLKEFPSVHVVDHPLVQHKLTEMRDKSTPMWIFRQLVREVSLLIAYEATANMKLRYTRVETPFGVVEDAPTLKEKRAMIVPILRAGLAIAGAFQEILPLSRIGYIGLRRNEKTKKPEEYLVKLPDYNEDTEVFLLDPMFATGGSAIHAVNVILAKGVPENKITFVAILGSMDAVKRFIKAFPKVNLYIASVSEKLNDNKYLVPGLGDAGDRIFGTE